ncbi:NTE family protein [Nitratiruptor sp. YY08-26]|uniref:patatin-like phospholipase family protein n=1 Tax=unclassified Nitratiruptor TaxID=2624044 RepID=UPI001916BE21|nr:MULTISPECIES: patatin-like phospholipase family protein [unclassified Nitratiruptor]BCD61390.1 NTE family protein [Nitratiruptor sp. YY08-13]BCD65324.1 NTE family protein [Nitratiruptor sp. YY08-26]
MKIAVALSGGGARCLAQLGYLHVLQQKLGIEFAALSGSSGGAIVGTFLALGLSPAKILEIIKKFNFSKIKLNLLHGTLFSLEPLIKELHQLGLKSFDELHIPLFVTLTSYDGKETLYVTNGDLARAVIASSSLIPIFAPTLIDGKQYIDGGFSDNLPVNPLLQSRYFTLAINVNPLDHLTFPQTLWGNFKRAGYVLLNTNIRNSIAKADKYVQIDRCQNFGILERKNFDAIYALGIHQAEKELKEWEEICLKNSSIKSSQ